MVIPKLATSSELYTKIGLSSPMQTLDFNEILDLTTAGPFF